MCDVTRDCCLALKHCDFFSFAPTRHCQPACLLFRQSSFDLACPPRTGFHGQYKSPTCPQSPYFIFARPPHYLRTGRQYTASRSHPFDIFISPRTASQNSARSCRLLLTTSSAQSAGPAHSLPSPFLRQPSALAHPNASEVNAPSKQLHSPQGPPDS